MNKLLIKVGTSNFRKLVSTDGLTADLNRLFVDKTLFIKEFLDYSNDIVLITRPRRWGKSLTLSMLQHFLSPEVDGLPTDKLFDNLKISQYLNDSNYKKYQSSYPVILVSFKDLKTDSFEQFNQAVSETIAKLYREHDYLLESLKQRKNFLFKTDETYASYAKEFTNILFKKANFIELKNSLKTLSLLLRHYHGKKVIILIDEYDNAINYAFDKPKVLDEITDFFGVLFSACLKENEDNVEKGLITGILRIAKANIFSGLNNPTEETILDDSFSDSYGFTEAEVDSLLVKANLTNNLKIKDWYNGYIVGKHNIYNPWSIMQCISKKGYLDSYWVDTANPKMIEDLLINKSSIENKQKIRDLIKHNQATLVDEELEKKVSFDDLNARPAILWSLLIHAGYLTLIKTNNNKHYVRLPNQEIVLLIKKYVDNWFISQPFLTRTANSLLIGDFAEFEQALKEIVKDKTYSARIFSGGGNATKFPATHQAREFIYQFLIMTELRCINLANSQEYEVFAELENISVGKTRPDVFIINHKDKLCIVIEIKVANNKNNDLNQLAYEEALGQIKKNQYGKKYQEEYGYKILPVGLAFKGNNFILAY